jgi:hypothetical protein
MNKNYAKRDEIIFGKALEDNDYMGGIKVFGDLPHDKLQQLLDLDFADPDDAQNASPTIGKFLEFLKKHPEVKTHGYVVAPERDDYRVTIEGIHYEGTISEELRKDFKDLCKGADEKVIGKKKLFCWWD